MKESKILMALGQVGDQYIMEAEPMKKARKKVHWTRYASVAACLALVAVIGVGIFRGGLFGTKTDVASLDSGETITFVKGDVPATTVDLDVNIRPLRDEEIRMLFSDLPVTANAYFDTGSHTAVGFEGKINGVKLVVSTSAVKLVDAVVEGSEHTSTVGGVPVNAGYFVSGENSHGIRTVIYYATFSIGENSVYAEYSGVQSDSERVRDELADAVLKLIENGVFDLSRIQE